MTSIDCDANASYADKELLSSHFNGLLKNLYNPSSLHRGGQGARALVEEARESIRRLVGAGREDHIVFTSGATEGNTMVVNAYAQGGAKVVSSAIEHPCILGPLAVAASRAAMVTLVAPTASGIVPTNGVEQAVSSDTSFVSIMAANNETGVLQPVREIVERVRGRALKAVIHSDVVQLPGKAGCTFADLGVDIMTLSGHKFGALAGVGCVVAKGSLTLAPLIVGGPQEEKLRGGTENVLGIAMMGIAAEKIAVDADRIQRMQAARDTFESFVLHAMPECEINGVTEERLPNTTSLFVPGIRADDLVVALDLSGVLISAGAACTSGKPEPSHVLLAMGQSEERVRSTVRVSMRGDYPEGTPERVAKMFVTVVERMRRGGNPARAA